ncbi:Gfo/Idh/MocA family protein [Thalassoglobus neptunius]
MTFCKLSQVKSISARSVVTTVAVILCMTISSSFATAEEMIRVGIIGLDTSHAPAFAKVMNDPENAAHVPGCRVVAAYPKGSPDIETSTSRIPLYTQQFRDMDIEIVDSIDELLTRVDAVLLETNDGRPHLEQVRPVLAAGKPVFIDKPIAGSLSDAVSILKEAKEAGVPIFSSSSLRYLKNGQEVRNGSIGEVTGADTYSPASLESTHPDLFWYGIHGVEALFTVLGTGCEEVVRMKTEDFDVVVGTWDDGRIGSFRGLRRGERGYGGTAFGTKGTQVLGPYQGYGPLVVEIVEFFQTGVPPVSARETIEIYAFMEAADESIRRNGKPVRIDEVLRLAGWSDEDFPEESAGTGDSSLDK